ncbi:MAG: hypothetical protein ACRDRS_14470 [Pseudonocardiaceae bacterium]
MQFLLCDGLAAILNPGVVHVRPPLLDLAWVLAIDLPHEVDPASLLDGYGRDVVHANARRPHLLLHRLVDTLITGHHHDGPVAGRRVAHRAPHL